MTTTIIRPLDLNLLTLASGAHNDPGEQPPVDNSACLLEACAYMAGEPWSDRPQCVCTVLGSFGRRLNDLLPAARRQLLVPLIPAMLGTAGDGLADVRRYMAVDWAVRTGAPMWLDAAGRTEYAAELRALAPITDYAGRQAILPRLWEIREQCWAARREALAKVRSTAADAAAAAAADAAAAAAAAADAAAAAAAAADAAAAAAAVAAAAAGKTWHQTYDQVYAETKARIEEKLAPVTEAVHLSAIDLFTRMVSPG